MTQVCPGCQELALEALDEHDPEALMCMSCGDEYSLGDATKYSNYCVAKVVSVTPLKGTKLKQIKLDIGSAKDEDEEELLQVVTDSKHVEQGELVVVARVGAIVPAGADPASGTVVEKTTLGGQASHGILCDAAMLGWKGTTGIRVRLAPESGCKVGRAPPLSL